MEGSTAFSSEPIRDWVSEKVTDGSLYWREPFLSVVGKYAGGKPLEEIEGLHPEVPGLVAGRIEGFEAPRAHQSAAIERALAGHNVVIATGTGSGKSFAFFVPVISEALEARDASVAGVKAVVIYPMNALANAQYEDLVKLIDGTGLRICNYQRKLPELEGEARERWRELTGRAEPRECEVISRDALRKPPSEGGGTDILITNYVMLEYALTRFNDRHLFGPEQLGSMRTLVLDEVHTYSGRQGADVACLIRRFKEHAGAKDLRCIATSATIDSSDDESAGEATAEFTTDLFGEPFSAEHIIVDEPALAEIDPSVDPEVAWLERTLAAETLGLDKLGERFAAEIGGDARDALSRAVAEGKLAPKAHAFFSQGRQISLCIRSAGTDQPHLSEHGETACQQCATEGIEDVLALPIVFCIGCGQEYLVGATVATEKGSGFAPREFEGMGDSEGTPVYIYPANWDATEVPPDPDALKKDGTARKNHEGAVPENVLMCGRCGTLHGACEHTADERPIALIRRPFMFCPACGIRHGRAREFNKFRQVGLVGRASATDVLISRMIDELEAPRKLLAFCDNRQDSSFQFSHLNAFHRRLHFRRALHAALSSASEPLSPVEAGWAALGAMKEANAVPDYAGAQTSKYGSGAQKAERRYAEYLAFAAVLEGSGYARLAQPSLVDAGAARIVYDGLDGVAADEALWEEIAELSGADPDLRHDYALGLLDIARRARAFDGDAFLDGEGFAAKIVDQIKETAHCHDPAFPASRPTVFTEEALNPRRFNIRGLLGAGSSPVRWTKRFFGLEKGDTATAQRIVRDTVGVLVHPNVGLLTTAADVDAPEGLVLASDRVTLESLDAPQGQRCPRCGARYGFLGSRPCVGCIKVETILAPSGDDYALDEYRAALGSRPPILAEEHSGQVRDEQRVRAETQFNDPEAALNVLVCTPTMELGIDVGQLSGTYMRNVPPSPANYTQRAGRAGRHGQPSLVLTFCGSGGRRGPHDRYFFERPERMISGRIAPPRFLLDNEALIASHLNSLVLSHLEVKLDKPGELINLEDDGLPLFADKREAIETGVGAHREKILAAAGRVFAAERHEFAWLTDEWIEKRVDGFALGFDAAWNRFRGEYAAGRQELDELHARAQSAALGRHEIRRRESIEARLNDMREGRGDHYAYSRLAGDGFLPNYAFPRRAALAFMTDRQDAIPRAKPIALREFAPGNSIYYRGIRYQVDRALLAGGAAEHWDKIKTCGCGAYVRGDAIATQAACPRCGASLMETVAYDSALELPDALARRRRRVSADEEERQRRGYRIEARYALSGARRSGQLGPLGIRYSHNGSLLLLNEGARASDDKGFTQCLRCRQWDPDPDRHFGDDSKCGTAEESLRAGIVLFTEGRHDLLELSLPLGTTQEAALSLAHALETGIEVAFQLDDYELSNEVFGDDVTGRRILLYESDEGGIGILSRLGAGREWRRAIDRTLETLHIDPQTGEEAPNACVAACYDCLLTFYNQQWHAVLDRRPAVELLIALREAKFEGGGDDAERYEALLATAEGMEGDVLGRMRERGLAAPEKAHEPIVINGAPVMSADLYYAAERICVMCDGTPHEGESVAAADEKKRKRVKGKGYFVVAVPYDDIDAGLDELEERLGV